MSIRKAILISAQSVFPENPSKRYVFKLHDDDAKEIVNKYIVDDIALLNNSKIDVRITIDIHKKPIVDGC